MPVVLPRPDVRTLRLSGPDRVRFLNGMITQDVTKLHAGESAIAVKTNNKGKIEAVLRVRATESTLELDVRALVAGKLAATLERFIIMDDCTIADVSSERAVVSVLGPDAGDVVRRAYSGALIADDVLGGFELHVPPAEADAVLAKLVAAGATRIDEAALDVYRIERGVPIEGRDLDEDTLPMEARLEPAINFSKGCYVGQEVITRATTLGHVNHLLVGLRFTGEVPAEGAPLSLGDKPVGEVTSVARSSLYGPIGLGYVRRQHAEPGTALVGAVVTALPFTTAPA